VFAPTAAEKALYTNGTFNHRNNPESLCMVNYFGSHL